MIWNDSETTATTAATETNETNERWLELAELLGVPLHAADIHAAGRATGGDTTETARRLFPTLSAEALHEVLWAIGERDRRECLLAC